MSSVSSNEITAYYRSLYPEISLDSMSKSLCSTEGVALAKDFEKNVYPLVGRHISLRNRFFFEQVKGLLNIGVFDSVVSFGSGLSLLTLQIARCFPTIRFIDTDLLQVIEARRAKLKELGGNFMPKNLHIEIKEFNIEEGFKASLSIQENFLVKKPVIILEGVSYFLSFACLKWFFSEITKFNSVAIVFDYWPPYAKQSLTFNKMSESFKTSISEEVKKTLSDFDVADLSSLKVLEDVELRDTELMYSNEILMNNLNNVVPARFRVLCSKNVPTRNQTLGQ